VKVSASLLCVIALSSTSFAADSGSKEPIRLASLEERGLDASTLSYELTRTFLTKEEWDEQVSQLRKRYNDWEKDNDGADMGRFLNDRFIMVALGAVSGEVEKIKRGIIWLAFYKEFNQQVPGVVSTAVVRHKESLTRLFKDFSWEKASTYVKNKEWRNDIRKKSSQSDNQKGS